MTRETWKTQTWWSIPVYTGDVSGVCSALYELGGMVVMHDPSGCNSTYNTHDEIRWSHSESLIFLSGLTQMDAITGNDRRLIDDIVSAANQFHPQFIAIAGSPVPWLIGTDFAAVCARVTLETGIPAFHVETNAMHDYTRGAGQAFLKLAKMLFEICTMASGGKSGRNAEKPFGGIPGNLSGKVRVNVLGMTPLDFTNPGETGNLKKALGDRGFEVVSVWAMGDPENPLPGIRKSLQSDVNLVVSSCGIDTARWMEETFGIPYVVGIPCGAFADILFASLSESARDGKSRIPYLDDPGPDPGQRDKSISGKEAAMAQGAFAGRCVAGETVMAGSLAANLRHQDGKACDMVPLTETVRGLIPAGAICPKGERQIRQVLGAYEEVIGDPMLRQAVRCGCRFEELPHFALSGRVFLDRIRPLI